MYNDNFNFRMMHSENAKWAITILIRLVAYVHLVFNQITLKYTAYRRSVSLKQFFNTLYSLGSRVSY